MIKRTHRNISIALLVLMGAVHPVAAENLTPEQFDVVREAPEGALDPAFRLSGELRERTTYRSAINFEDDAPEEGAFWTQRLALTGEGNATPWLRGRMTLLSALQESIPGSPIERNNLDVQEGFLDLGPADGRGYLRLGRQELVLGSQRLVGSRNGTNVKRTWDGLRGTVDIGQWQLQGLALREVRVRSNGVFNDASHDGPRLYGLYGTGEVPGIPGALDLYFLSADFDRRATIEGTADQQRHSVGVRSFGERGRWFWNWEGIYQFGDHGDAQIRAWSLAANTGYRFDRVSWQPELMLSANVGSGDERNGDGELGTFDALFARGSYFSELALLAPSNFFNIHPYLRMRPRANLLAFVDVNFYWRLEREDGVYVNPTVLLRAPEGEQARFVNLSVSAGVQWEPGEKLFFSVLYTHAQPQSFIERTGPSRTIDFVEFTARFNF